MAEISSEEVRHVAQLARLDLSGDELSALRGELAAVLDHVDVIRGLDTSGVPPTAHPLPLCNVLRPDEVGPCLERSEVLEAAPEVGQGRYFQVPKIVGDEP